MSGKIFLTSDLHFCHDKEFIYNGGGRRYVNVDDMNNAIVKAWNFKVQPDDIVYLLGDCMLNDNTKGLELLKSLNGTKFLAIGNHDTDARIKLYREHHIFEDIQYAYRFVYNKHTFYCTHYPTLTGNYKEPAIIMCYGHTHQTNPVDTADICGEGKYLNMIHIGWDSWHKPVEIDDVLYTFYENIRKHEDYTALMDNIAVQG